MIDNFKYSSFHLQLNYLQFCNENNNLRSSLAWFRLWSEAKLHTWRQQRNLIQCMINTNEST